MGKSITFAVLLAITGCGGSSPTSPTAVNPRVTYVSPSGNDSNSGAIGAPFATLRHALRQLHAGDTLYLRQGIYEEPLLEVNFGAGGRSWATAVTVAGYEGERVVMQGIPGGDNAVRFQDGSVSYVEVRGLIIDGGGTSGASALVYLGSASHHVRFRNVEVANAQGNGVLAGGYSHEFIGMKVHHNGLRRDYSTGSNGMYMTTNDSTIDGGEFYDNDAFGVRFFNSDPGQFANNNVVRNARVFNNGFGVGLGGISVTSSDGGGIVLGDAGNVAQDNQVFSNYQGILVFGFGSKASSHARIANNAVHDNIESGIRIQPGATNTDVNNNRIYANGTGILNQGTATVLSNNSLD